MYKIVNGDAPSYLIDLLPNRVNSITAYNLRNSNDFEIPFSRLCSYENSYFPSTLKLWNELDPQVRTLPTISRFKSNIKTIPDKIPDYTNVGERKYNIMLTRIRHRSSSLKADLYGVNIIPSHACSCGAPIEMQTTIFFECPLYINQRNNFFINLDRLQINDADVAVLTTGSPSYDENINISVIQFAIKFIKDSQRFEWLTCLSTCLLCNIISAAAVPRYGRMKVCVIVYVCCKHYCIHHCNWYNLLLYLGKDYLML